MYIQSKRGDATGNSLRLEWKIIFRIALSFYLITKYEISWIHVYNTGSNPGLGTYVFPPGPTTYVDCALVVGWAC